MLMNSWDQETQLLSIKPSHLSPLEFQAYLVPNQTPTQFFDTTVLRKFAASVTSYYLLIERSLRAKVMLKTGEREGSK